VLDAVRHLYGMQARAPNPPYIGLWARLAGFAHDDLARLLHERRVVRLSLMRSTIHLVTAEDCMALRDRGRRGAADLPEASRPAPDTPAPVRYLSEFDNMLLSFADRTRTRIMADEYRARVFTINGIIKATVLVDGFVRGMWKVTQKRGEAVLEVDLFQPVLAGEREELEREGMRLLDFVAPSAKVRDIRLG
jgi:hypothetical protein